MLKLKNFLYYNKLKIKSSIEAVDLLNRLNFKDGKKEENNEIMGENEKIQQIMENQTSVNFSSTPEKDNDDEKTKEKEIKVEKKSVEIVQPSYMGYLSSVFTSVFDQAYGAVGEKISSLQQQSKKDEVKKSLNRDTSQTKISKILVKQISRAELLNLTKLHIDKILLAQSTNSRILRIQALTLHVQEFRSTRMIAMNNHLLIEHLIDLVKNGKDVYVREEARKCLAMLGNSSPLKSPGIRILSIDGGGTRGMIGLTILEEIEKASGKRVYELYDHIFGVSTGAILAVLLGVFKLSVKECRQKYMNISRKLFNQRTISGLGEFFKSQAFYNTELWIQILKESVGESITFADTAKFDKVPKIGIVSCLINSPELQPYVFRNYEFPPGYDSLYKGGSNYKVWQAVQASTAAPTYFKEVYIDPLILQDGGVLANNPTSIAVHEAINLWPNDEIQCVVSVGNGRSVSEIELMTEDQKIKVNFKKYLKIIDSATDTEAIHNCINNHVFDDRYFRFNPYMTFPYTLNEIQPEKLEQMQKDANSYVRRNRKKIKECAKQLTQTTSATQKFRREVEKKLNSMGILKSDF